MKAEVLTLDAKKAGDVELDEGIYALPERADILQRVVVWQLAKRRAGTHKVLTRGEVAGTTKRIGKQKGGGTARHGAGKVSQFRSGGRAFGPVVRSHATNLPKKIRTLGLKTALSSKLANGNLIVLENMDLKEAKTKELKAKLSKLGLVNALFIDGAEVNRNFLLAASNIPYVDVLPTQGANVYDILRADKLVLSKAALESLTERLK
ncbi:50S ribosomal protein L4 [Paremcibacter congregatus]|uniref:Large ribosomal subunit protein uL4 n=1 Tax=Paremcibacter congregatus TaxID=2043170 RepID=A0A2G4YMF7_9PROT|nr:50S ribosomal protein L4 [Paremcibacter congregatus]PHZ83519.1 50S ribosomal protein L4 [Paremcibacter congregatus]QDE28395.1 50S ribosomal protein L4 [Paremcibacter congregatus]